MHTNSPINDVTVTSESVEPPSWTGRYEAFLRWTLEKLDVRDVEFSVVFCDDHTIRALNATYRDRDEVTDVLSFVADEGASVPAIPGQRYRPIGDILIDLERVRAQADENDVPWEEEIRRVSVHGLLHLLGETHTGYDVASEPMLRHQEALVQEYKEKLF